MDTTSAHDQTIALSDKGRALVLALLISYRQSLEAHFKRQTGRARRPTPADMELAQKFELTLELISQLEATGH